MDFFKRKAKVASDIGMQCSRQGMQCRVSLSGRITNDSAPDLRVVLLGRLSDPSCQDLTVDLGEITYIDVSGVAVLLEVLRAAHVQGKMFQLNRLPEQPRNLLEATRLLHLFDEQTSKPQPEDHSIPGGSL